MIPAEKSALSGLRKTVLAYHEVAPEKPAYTYALGCADFEQHLRFAAEFGNNSPLTFSFDDGHISNYIHALPLLEKYSCKATFFVIAGRIGAHRDFMTWQHLKELVALGHRVEAHSWSHTFLTRCSDAELDLELARSKQSLEDRLGMHVTALSAPHGRWDRRVAKACAKAGYRQLYTSTPWSTRRVIEQVEIIGRLVVQQSMDRDFLLRWLAMGRTQAGLGRVRHAFKQSARRVLGNKIYYQLWARFSGWTGPEDTALRVD